MQIISSANVMFFMSDWKCHNIAFIHQSGLNKQSQFKMYLNSLTDLHDTMLPKVTKAAFSKLSNICGLHARINLFIPPDALKKGVCGKK